MNRIDLKEWIICLGITTMIFLPVRMVYWTYVSHAWGRNLGIMSIIAVTMFVLIKYKKLGWFGEMFHRRMIKAIFHKGSLYVVIGGTIWTSFILWVTLFLYDYGESHIDEIQFFNAIVIAPYKSDPYALVPDTYVTVAGTHVKSSSDNPYTHLPGTNQSLFMKPPLPYQLYGDWVSPEYKLILIQKMGIDSLLLIGSQLVYDGNRTVNGWGTHFAAVGFIGEIEGLGVFFFYRKAYKSKIKADSWEKLGLYNKHIRTIAKGRPLF